MSNISFGKGRFIVNMVLLPISLPRDTVRGYYLLLILSAPLSSHSCIFFPSHLSGPSRNKEVMEQVDIST